MANLADRCDAVIDSFYEASSLSDAVIIYDRTPEGETLSEVLNNIVSPRQKVTDDLIELLTEMWFDYSAHEHLYGDDPWFIEKTSLAEPMNKDWSKMEQSLLHEARFINPEVAKVLEVVFGSIHNDKTREGKLVIVELGVDCEIDTLYRARVFQTLNAMEVALSHPERHIGPPPSGVGVSGRMNAKGISVFYGATDKNIAISEVRPPVGSHVILAAFKLLRTFRVLDLCQLGSIALKSTSSPFDPATVIEASRRDFLKILTQRLVMPVMPELAEQNYLISQVIADFLSTHPELKLDGIIFSSAQTNTNSQDTRNRNVILFNKASKVLHAEDCYGGNSSVHLFDYDEDCPSGFLMPEIYTKECQNDMEDHNEFLWIDKDHNDKPTLKLDRDAIEIYEIEGVEYQKTCHKVLHTIVRSI
ncbi:RES family NAD+ phosphorylase [Nitrosomonas sp.]|uniref:RES family NAD+ phosphorylase n=1 Tax=Nitrosomonas sp. TaxID=42353 RepID=UPI0032EB757F